MAGISESLANILHQFNDHMPWREESAHLDVRNAINAEASDSESDQDDQAGETEKSADE